MILNALGLRHRHRRCAAVIASLQTERDAAQQRLVEVTRCEANAVARVVEQHREIDLLTRDLQAARGRLRDAADQAKDRQAGMEALDRSLEAARTDLRLARQSAADAHAELLAERLKTGRDPDVALRAENQRLRQAMNVLDNRLAAAEGRPVVHLQQTSRRVFPLPTHP